MPHHSGKKQLGMLLVAAYGMLLLCFSGIHPCYLY